MAPKEEIRKTRALLAASFANGWNLLEQTYREQNYQVGRGLPACWTGCYPLSQVPGQLALLGAHTSYLGKRPAKVGKLIFFNEPKSLPECQGRGGPARASRCWGQAPLPAKCLKLVCQVIPHPHHPPTHSCSFSDSPWQLSSLPCFGAPPYHGPHCSTR